MAALGAAAAAAACGGGAAVELGVLTVICAPVVVVGVGAYVGYKIHGDMKERNAAKARQEREEAQRRNSTSGGSGGNQTKNTGSGSSQKQTQKQRSGSNRDDDDEKRRGRKISPRYDRHGMTWYDRMLENWEWKAKGPKGVYYQYHGYWYSPDHNNHAGSMAKKFRSTGGKNGNPTSLVFLGSVDVNGDLIDKHESNHNKGSGGDVKGKDLYNFKENPKNR